MRFVVDGSGVPQQRREHLLDRVLCRSGIGQQYHGVTVQPRAELVV
jgi:hypothetical protein